MKNIFANGKLRKYKYIDLRYYIRESIYLINKKMTIIKYDNLKIDEINYSKPEKMGTSYFSPFSIGKTLEPIHIQTPKVKCITNINDVKDKKNPYLEIEIPTNNFDIYDMFLSLDDSNIKKTLYHSSEWFNKEIPLEAIDEMYQRITKPFKKGGNPKLKLRLPVIKNKIECAVYNQQRVFVDIDDIKEGSEIIAILHLRGLRFLKQHFYCDYYISQIKLFQDTIDSKFSIIKDYSLIDDEKQEDIFDEEIINAFKETIDIEKIEKEKLEKIEKLEKEKLEKGKLENEKLEKEKIEKLEKADKIAKLQAEIEIKHKEIENLNN